MARKLKYNQDARESMAVGMEKVAMAVEGTLGPKGKNVVLDKSHLNGTCIVTNDGVSIARDIILEDPFENQGAQLLVEVAGKTNDMVGDGTTTSIVLAKAMVNEGLKNLTAGANPINMRKGMKKALDVVIESLSQQAIEVKDNKSIAHIGTVASGDEMIGQMIAEAMDKVSNTGFITLEDSKTSETKLNIIEGMRLKTGYLSRYMCTEKKEKIIQYYNSYILITDSIISNVKTIIPILEQITNEKGKLVIIASDIAGDALTTIVLNDVKGIFQVAAVKAPGFGEMQRDILQDLAILTGATCFFEELGLDIEKATLDMLGRAEHVKIDSENTIVMGGHGKSEKVQERINQIKKTLSQTDSEFNKERLRERISKLKDGIAVIQVGADTEIEMIEKKLRVEDAIASTKSAVLEGIVAGGGCAYIHAAKRLNKIINLMEGDERVGAALIQKAIQAPLYQIAVNGGLDGHVVVQKVMEMESPMGFDALSENYKEMIKAGIVDPLMVVKTSLTNAVSIVSTFLTTEAINIIVKGTEQEISSM